MRPARVRAGETELPEGADQRATGNRAEGGHLRDGMHGEIDALHDRQGVLMGQPDKEPAY